jgi:PAS domain-containing protein
MKNPATEAEQASGRVSLAWVALAFSGIYWILESVRDVLAFGKGPLIQRLFYPDLPSVWSRLLIVAMIMAFGFYAQFLRKSFERSSERHEEPTGQSRVIWIGLAFVAAYWVLDSARNMLFFEKGMGGFVRELISPNVASLSVRLLAVSVIVLFSIYVQNLINERRQAEEAMQQSREELEAMVQQRTVELTRSNEQLRQEMDSRRRLESALWVSRRSFHDVVDAVSDGIVIVDQQNRVRFVNPTTETMLGRHTDELVGEAFVVPVKPGATSRLSLGRSGGEPVQVDLKVVQSEWQGEPARLILLRRCSASDEYDPEPNSWA